MERMSITALRRVWCLHDVLEFSQSKQKVQKKALTVTPMKSSFVVAFIVISTNRKIKENHSAPANYSNAYLVHFTIVFFLYYPFILYIIFWLVLLLLLLLSLPPIAAHRHPTALEVGDWCVFMGERKPNSHAKATNVLSLSDSIVTHTHTQHTQQTEPNCKIVKW